MIYLILGLLGLCMGSFVNALVWRLHEQDKSKNKKLSILNGRSMCPNCKHELAPIDLVPIFSWIGLKGKCRSCKKPISLQYPIVELVVAAIFVKSYIFWPIALDQTWQYVALISWLIISVGLIALVVYDLRWMLLPDKIVYSLIGIAALSYILQFLLGRPLNDLFGIFIATVIGGGIFLILYEVSRGKWIGGGDVKLGFLLGLLVAKPEFALLLLFLASVLGMVFVAPLLITKKLTKTSKVPFGPFLILAAFVVIFIGRNIIDWYQSTMLIR
jgi:prepilin signal peptidase PulO-like enzyme (type II secretory pathway)